VDKDIDFNAPGLYRIRLKERLDPVWGTWFSGFAIAEEADGGSILTGLVADQAELHGLLRKMRDLGLTMVSLQRIEIQTGAEGMA